MTDPLVLYSRILDALKAEDDAVTVRLFDPEFVIHEDPGMPYGGELRGAESFIKLRHKVYDSWGENCLELLFKCGDPDGQHAASVFRLTDRRAGVTGRAESYVTVVWTFRDDLATEVRVFYYDTPRLSLALATG
jgi:hypothetical protein